TIRNVFSEILHAEGFECSQAADAEEALSILAKSEIDVVLTDIVMPGVSGLDLIRKIRESFHSHVIAFTGYVKDYNYPLAIHVGADDFMLKQPFICEELVARVRRLLKERTFINERNTACKNLEATNQQLMKYVEELNRVCCGKESERKYHDLITNMSELLYIVDLSGRITFVSPSAKSISQYEESELIGHHMEEFVFKEDLPRLQQSFQDLLSGRGKMEDEYRLVTKIGAIRWVWTRTTTLSEGGRTIGFQGLLSDITERKRSEENAQAARDMLQLIMNNIPQGIFWKDRISTYLGCNNVFARDVGLESAGSIVGKTDYDLPWTTEQSEFFREYDRRVMENDVPEYHIIEQQRKTDGKLAWLETNKVPLHDPQGNVIGILGTYKDITERKLMEKALRESEEKFRSLVETTSDWIWEVDAGGVYIYASPRVRDLLGYKPEEVLGRKPFEFMPPEESARLKAHFSRMIKERKGCLGLENVNIHKDGRRVILETSCVPKLDSRGDLLGYRGIDRDITDRKLAEVALRRSHEKLELRVQERTAELELRNRELQNFTFAAAHDLQEPLRKIQTFSDLITTKYCASLDTAARSYMHRMHETATRMRDVLQSLIKYSTMISQLEQSVRLDFNQIAREVVSDFQLMIRDTGAVVEIGTLPEIEGDPGKMRQLLQNLLGNALKFRREHIQPLVQIYSDCRPQEGECCIFIKDNGIGFDEKYLDRIFKPFQRLHGKDDYGGIGMGLAISAKVVEQHKGRITARSTPGKGSTFIVTLPMSSAES
ncbi:MAG: PAS domain S-box protein, partial [Desulfobacterales bacterium]|nr:PAS domain S-box protein [Desulfobacterales bacterium]